ncbi:MAG: hypothetical protein KJN89_09910 [Gammaproteobacteria bacterium]|nr:hypothetical protein [Gammaproteobacteria bacterium]MBT8133191.1 hypothetical protein [Gammaproteobacteria bacterium]NNJ50679.1 hypothetical protein [Gammaproteobacteria bacterium]
MMSDPGVSREKRISNEGLARLEKQLELGMNIKAEVLQQWVRRYGDDARELLKKYHRELDD